MSRDGFYRSLHEIKAIPSEIDLEQALVRNVETKQISNIAKENIENKQANKSKFIRPF